MLLPCLCWFCCSMLYFALHPALFLLSLYSLLLYVRSCCPGWSWSVLLSFVAVFPQKLNNGSREWERERYDLYLIQLARINYISRKNHWLWQRRVPVNCVQIIFHKIFNKKFYLPVAFGATHSYFCNSIICKIELGCFLPPSKLDQL